MMTRTLQDLAQYRDVGSLESALRALCEELCSPAQLDILTLNAGGRRKAVCFLRLASAQQEEILISKLGASRFGDEICVVVNLNLPERES
jgi:hypothetical protein